MRVIQIKIYTIEDHPNVHKCYSWIRNNWLHLNEHNLEELIASLKALQNQIGGELDYSFGCWPSRGEYIHLTNYDKEQLKSLVANDCPLTGTYWDSIVINWLNGGEHPIKCLHKETEYVYSDKGLKELCIANDYEFLLSGEFYSL